MGLCEFPVGDGAFGGDGGAVAVVEVLAEAGGQVRVRRRFVAGGEGDGGEGVDVAGEEDGRGGEAGTGLDVEDGVEDHQVLALVDAQADAFADPDFFAAEVEAVVVAVGGGGGEGVEGLDEGVAFVDGFGAEDAAVDFYVARSVLALQDCSPVYRVVAQAAGCERLMCRSRCAPGKPGP